MHFKIAALLSLASLRKILNFFFYFTSHTKNVVNIFPQPKQSPFCKGCGSHSNIMMLHNWLKSKRKDIVLIFSQNWGIKFKSAMLKIIWEEQSVYFSKTRICLQPSL